MTDDPEILTTNEVAAEFGVSAATIRSWVRAGKLPTVEWPGRGLRIPREAVLKFKEPKPLPEPSPPVTRSDFEKLIDGLREAVIAAKAP